MTKINHGGAIVAQQLQQAGVGHLFTLCGGHISPILVQAKALGIEIVDVRDEASAVFAADAYARLTGGVGVAAVTAGPGVTNTITAVKNAQMAQSAVLIIGGATPTVLKNRGSLQDIDQLSLMASITKWQASVGTLAQLKDAMSYGLALCRQGVPGPVFIEAPIDILYPRDLVSDMFAEQSGFDKVKGPIGALLRSAVDLYLKRQEHQPTLGLHPNVAAVPRQIGQWRAKAQLAEVSRKLQNAKRPVLVLGSQIVANKDQTAAEEIAQAIGSLGIPTWTGGMARGLLGANHPQLFRHNRGKALKQADLVIIAGFPFDFRLKYGRGFARDTTLVSINLSQDDLRLNKTPDVPVLSHPGEFLQSLAAQNPNRQWPEWFKQLQQREQQREQQIDQQAEESSEGVNPLALFRQLDKVMQEDDILVVDGGDFVATSAYTLKPRKPLSWLDPGVFGTLGVGGGFTLGAGMAKPNSGIWLIYGDGSSAYSLAEFDTYVRMGMAPIALIGTDASWGQIAREQEQMLGDNIGTFLRKTDYHVVAEGYGGKGLLLDSDQAILDVLEQAQDIAKQGTPVCINVILAKSAFRKGSISM